MVKSSRMRSVKQYRCTSGLRCVKNVLLALLFPVAVFSQDTDTTKKITLHLHGYIKDIQQASFQNDLKSLTTGNLFHNRLNFKLNLFTNMHFRAEVRNRLFYGEQVKLTSGFGKYIDYDSGLADMSYNIVEDTSLVFNTTIDRLLINWSDSKWEITIGRQRINWGINMAWNPNDIFNAFNYFDFDYSERPGTDAIRIQHNTGKLTSIEIAYKLSDNKYEQVGAVLYKTNLKKYDFQGLMGVYYKDIVIGTGWAGNINNTGFKGEASYFHPYQNFTDTSGAFSATISLERSFKNNYFTLVSYLYNSEGNTLAGGITELTTSVLSAKKLMPFKHSFFLQSSKSITPLVNANASIIFSPKNNTLIIMPSIYISVSNNWDLSIIAQSFFHDQNNVYRSLGNVIYLRVMWSF